MNNKYTYAKIWKQLLAKLETIDVSLLKGINHQSILESLDTYGDHIQQITESIIDTCIHTKKQISAKLSKAVSELTMKHPYISQNEAIDHLIDLVLIYETFKVFTDKLSAIDITKQIHEQWLRKHSMLHTLRQSQLL